MAAISKTIKIDCNVPVTMRDGVILYADVYRPDDNEKHPIILERIPYDKSNVGFYPLFDPIRAAKNGYAAIYQDCRGSMISGGEYEPFGLNEHYDGYDTVEWAAVQPWSNGKVGMAGGSYMGMMQYCASCEQPPHLVCMFPKICYSDMHKSDVFCGGAFAFMGNVCWCVGSQAVLEILKKDIPQEKKLDMVARLYRNIDHIEESYWHLPLKTLPALRQDGLSLFYFDWLEHPDYDEYWKTRNYAVYEKHCLPMYHVTGWHDVSCGGTLDNFISMQTEGGSELARKSQKLIVGPWIHWTSENQLIGELNTGISSAAVMIDLDGIQLRWFDHWLKGLDNGIMEEPPVRIFVMGENKWRSENEWPLARTEYQKYFLHSCGKANTRNGNGTLSAIAPKNEPADYYIYDPKDPVPTKGGRVLGTVPSPTIAGSFDQSELELRPDVLVYTTEVLEKDTEVTGPLKVVLYASTSAKDTDFTAKLVDVWPNGKAYNLADGIIRARYRQTVERQIFIEPEKVYEYTIDLWATSNLFKAGHRIRIEISSSNFPRYDRNLNSGGVFGEEGADAIQVAYQAVFHTEDYPSHVLLPIIPRD